MAELVLEFFSEATAYIQGMGLLHIGPSPYTEIPGHPLVGREVVFNGQRRRIKYVERENHVPLSIKVAILNSNWQGTHMHDHVKRGDAVGLLFDDYAADMAPAARRGRDPLER